MKLVTIVIAITSLVVACGGGDPRPPILDGPPVSDGSSFAKDGPPDPGPGPGMEAGSIVLPDGAVVDVLEQHDSGVADTGEADVLADSSATETGTSSDSGSIPDVVAAETGPSSPLMQPCHDMVGNDCPNGYICRPGYSQSTGSEVPGAGTVCTRFCSLPQDCPAPSYGCDPLSKCSYAP